MEKVKFVFVKDVYPEKYDYTDDVYQEGDDISLSHDISYLFNHYNDILNKEIKNNTQFRKCNEILIKINSYKEGLDVTLKRRLSKYVNLRNPEHLRSAKSKPVNEQLINSIKLYTEVILKLETLMSEYKNTRNVTNISKDKPKKVKKSKKMEKVV